MIFLWTEFESDSLFICVSARVHDYLAIRRESNVLEYYSGMRCKHEYTSSRTMGDLEYCAALACPRLMATFSRINKDICLTPPHTGGWGWRILSTYIWNGRMLCISVYALPRRTVFQRRWARWFFFHSFVRVTTDMAVWYEQQRHSNNKYNAKNINLICWKNKCIPIASLFLPVFTAFLSAKTIKFE